MYYKKIQLRIKSQHKNMRAFFAFPVVLLCLLFSVGITAAGEKKDWPNENSALGINLGGVTYY